MRWGKPGYPGRKTPSNLKSLATFSHTLTGFQTSEVMRAGNPEQTLDRSAISAGPLIA